VRALRLLVNVRNARAALERVLADEHWPADRAMSLAIDRLLLLEDEAAALIAKAAEQRRRLA
jgi:hypothetical protein